MKNRLPILWLLFALAAAPLPAQMTNALDLDATDAETAPLDSAAARALDEVADQTVSEGAGVPFSAEPSGLEGETVPLSLRQAVLMALARNLDIAIERIEPVLSSAGLLTEEGAVYDPDWVLSSRYTENTQPIIVDTFSGFDTVAAGQRTYTYDTGIEQPLPWGGIADFSTNARNSQAFGDQFQDDWTSFVGIGLTQPLLDGFGTDVNLGPVRIARQNLSASRFGFRFAVERIVTEVADAYYELIFARGDLAAQQAALELAEQLLQDNKARVEIGVMSPLDVSQAQSEVASRRETALVAKRAILDQENVLKRLILADITPWLPRRVFPTTVPPRNYRPPQVAENIGKALGQRADLQAARNQVDAAGIQVVIDRNGLLPTVNLQGSLGYQARERDYLQSYSDIFDGEGPVWFAGVNVTMPINNREAEGTFDASRAREQRAVLQLKNLEQTIIVEVDNAAGQARTNAERIVAAKAARVFSEESLKAEQEKLNAGTSTSFVVLELQRDLTTARIRELRAIADLQQSLAELRRVEGDVLDEYGILIGAPDQSPSPFRTASGQRIESAVEAERQENAAKLR
ncbi:MAG: TolC family protein [Verrucomicrobiota bacterium]